MSGGELIVPFSATPPHGDAGFLLRCICRLLADICHSPANFAEFITLVGWPRTIWVKSGLVAGINRPSSNVTGMCCRDR
jgi:hypothetical protein